MEETHPHFNFNNEERIGEVTSHALTHLYQWSNRKSTTTSHIYQPTHSTNSRRSTVLLSTPIRNSTLLQYRKISTSFLHQVLTRSPIPLQHQYPHYIPNSNKIKNKQFSVFSRSTTNKTLHQPREKLKVTYMYVIT